jgi:hypothetical protein
MTFDEKGKVVKSVQSVFGKNPLSILPKHHRLENMREF